MLARLSQMLLDAVAPHRCAVCDLVSREAICARCRGDLSAMPLPRPRRISQGIAFAGFEFDASVRAALHRGKYGGDRGALQSLASLTVRRLHSGGSRLPAYVPDGIVAVPLGPRRRRQRGYNQAEVIATVIADERRLSLLRGLHRVRDTRPQSSADEEARRTNVARAFAWTGPALAGVHLWLVDDVLTTGATVEAASVALGEAGATRIDVVVIAVVP
jgi:ComF family protein